LKPKPESPLKFGGLIPKWWKWFQYVSMDINGLKKKNAGKSSK
jgi:hypothetical protein